MLKQQITVIAAMTLPVLTATTLILRLLRQLEPTRLTIVSTVPRVKLATALSPQRLLSVQMVTIVRLERLTCPQDLRSLVTSFL